MGNILVSIITVSYNSSKTIERTIESVLNQGYKNIEYIIIDGKSKDSTLEIIKKFEEKFKSEGINYKFISEKDNGIYDAMNKGISFCKGELIGIINSDDWYELDAVENIVSEYKNKKFDVIFGDMKVISPKKLFIKKAKNSNYFTTRGWTHPTMFVKNEVYSKERYLCKNIYDDLDFILRIKKKKYKVEVIHKVISNFTFGGISTNKNLKRVFEDIKMRNRIYIDNGYSKVHCIDNFIIEIIKYILG